MGLQHYVLFCLALFVCTLGLLVFSVFSTPMLVYDESDIYSCPRDAISHHKILGEDD